MKSCLRGLMLILACWLPAIAVSAEESGDNRTAATGGANELFQPTTIYPMHLEISAREWERMQKVVGRGPFGSRGPGQPAGRPEEKKADEPSDDEPIERHRSSGFGTEFPWARGTLTAAGRTFADVGVRYKGNGSYGLTSGSLKRNLKIELDHYGSNERLLGEKTLNLNAGGADPTRLREALAFDVFRAAGVPASRTAFVELTLTVPGKYDHELVGLYTLIEQVDKAFLRDRFGDSSGLLMKPEHLRELSYLGDDWQAYSGRLQPRHEPKKTQARRTIEFMRLLDRGSDEQFAAEIAGYLDVDEFLRFLAASAWLVNMDSMFLVGHNYYIYLDPKSEKFVFIPWDLDLSFAGFPMAGSPDQLLNLNLKHPHAGKNKLIDRLLASPEIARRYDEILKVLIQTAVEKQRLLTELESLEKATAEARAREATAVAARDERQRGRGFGGFGGPMSRNASLAKFIEERTDHVADQLAGKDPGYTPRGGFGPGGRGGFGPGNFMAPPLLAHLDADRNGKLSKDELKSGAEKFFATCDTQESGRVDEHALLTALAEIIPGPPGMNAPGGGPPGFGPPPAEPRPVAPPPRKPAAAPREVATPDDPPPGAEPPPPPRDQRPERREPGDRPPGAGNFNSPPRFNPAPMIAANLLKRADTDHDGQITRDEVIAAAEALFVEADSEKQGELDERKLAAAINALFPPPPGFGPPGGEGAPGGSPRGAGQPGAGPANAAGPRGDNLRDRLRRLGVPGFGRADADRPATAPVTRPFRPEDEIDAPPRDPRPDRPAPPRDRSGNAEAALKQDAPSGQSNDEPQDLTNPTIRRSSEDLAPTPARAAFELKFLIDEEQAGWIDRWASETLTLDPHGDPALGGAYRTTSLYCDTPELDVYRRTRWYRRRKFRIRRYGSAEAVFLERKARAGDRVAKRRTAIATGELLLLSRTETELNWPGYWFARRLAERRLTPACQISYERTAYVDPSAADVPRLTLDRQIHGLLADRWHLVPSQGMGLLAGQVILELKFRSSLPVRFKQLIESLRLATASVSKYRLCQDAHRTAESGQAEATRA